MRSGRKKVMIGGLLGKGGYSNAWARLAINLSNAGHDVCALARISSAGPYEPLRKELLDNGVEVFESFDGDPPTPKNYLKHILALKKILERVKPDVLDIHYGGILPWGADLRAAKMAGVPEVYCNYHGLIIEGKTRLPKFHALLESRSGAKLATKHVFLSPYQAENFRKWVGTGYREDVIPLGVKTDHAWVEKSKAKELIGVDKDAFFIFTAARLMFGKNLVGLVRALGQSEEFMKRGVIWIAGEGEAEKDILEACEKFIPGRFKLLGFRSDLDNYFFAADLHAQLSYHETFGLVYLEACSYRLASVAYYLPSLASFNIDGQTGRIVEMDNEQAVTDAVNELMRNPELLEKLSQGAYDLINSNYEIGYIVTRFEKLFGLN